MRLIAPESYRRSTAAERRKYCNGCGGAATGFFTRMVNWCVPNKIHGVRATPACNIHDWMYGHGMGKFTSDIVFLCNLLTLCWFKGSRWIYPWRALRCMTFYMAVTLFGRRFYGRKVADKLERRRRGKL